MKLLFLGSSNDTGNWVKDGPKRHELLRDRLAAEFDEPVEVVVKNTWPNERMAGLIARWMTEETPDAVYLNTTSYPFSYESLPLRMKRVLGRLGPAVGDAGLRFAESERWAHNRVFRTIRQLGQATVGGDTHFTCDEVIERYSETIRVVLRHEGVCLIVKGPHGIVKTGISGREHRRREAKRLRVHGALQAFCNGRQVTYVGRDAPMWRERRPTGATQAGDGLHANAAGHAQLADDLFRPVRDAWVAHLAETGETKRTDRVQPARMG